MMDWDYGMSGGWLVACLSALAVLALVVLVVVALTQGSRWGSGPGHPTARDILDARLARGEIDVEEYRRTLDVLRDGETVRRGDRR